MNRYIFAGIVLGISMLGCGCGHMENRTEQYTLQESGQGEESASEADEEINFRSAAVEEKTRELLGKTDGIITKADVLAITAFEMEAECAAPFEDLQWFENLESVSLFRCGVQRLDGVERLTSLKGLWVRDNEITDIGPVSDLTSLVNFSCAGNPVSDYSPVRKLTNLEELQIGDNGCAYTDIDALSGLTNLTSLYAPWCGIEDVSALENLTELEYLNLFHNRIADIGALEHLAKLHYLELGLNQVTDIAPLYGLNDLTDISLRDNEIPTEELAAFYEWKNAASTITVTQKGRLREDMPEFTFRLSAYWDLQWDGYALQSLEICEGDTVLQTISIPELAIFGQTRIYDSMEDTLGFELEDVNFDGYLDIRQYDTSNGNYREEWIYLVWDPGEYRFEYDASLNQISLATFDQEEQLIYGMERGGAVCHYYSTYQYISGEPVKIRYVEEEGILLDDDKLNVFCIAASGKEASAPYEGMWFYLHTMERNEETGGLETVSKEYVFDSDRENEEFRVDADSELGQRMAAEIGDSAQDY